MSALAIKGGSPVRTAPWPSYPIWDESEEKQLTAVLQSGEWGRMEEGWLGKFETAFAAFQDAKHCIGVNSGTSALIIALKAVGVEYGDEVIIPPYTFLATATACLAVNAIPVWCDVRADTLTLDPDKLESLITPRTKAVVPVLVAGTPCHSDEIKAIAQKHGVAVIDDACQAHGAIYKGRRVGAIGDAGAFSFQWSKNITSGEGGAMVTDDDRVYDVAWAHHNCGRLKSNMAQQAMNMSWNLRMPAFQAGLLVPQIQRGAELFQRRADNVAYLRKKLYGFAGVRIQTVPGEGSVSAYHLLLCRLMSEHFKGVTKQQFLAAISAEGIPFGGGYNPLYQAGMFQRDGSGKSPAERHTGLEIDPAQPDCPTCEHLCTYEAFWAGQRVLLGDTRDIADIADAILKVYEHAEELRAD